MLTDADGNIPLTGAGSGLGFYARDTRHLSTYDFLINGTRSIVLQSSAATGYGQEQVLGNHRFEQDGIAVGRATLQFTRERVLNGNLEELLQINNYNPFPVRVLVGYRFAADFADIFEVRGHQRKEPGRHAAPEITEDSIIYRYLGRDGEWRKTAISFDRPPDLIDGDGASFNLTLSARSETRLQLRIAVEEHEPHHGFGGLTQLRQDYADWRTSFAHLHTSNEVFNQVLDRSINDLRMLWTRGRQDHGYIAAGTPWYATLFGRDSIITALQVLPFRPDLARECLALLARHQGQNIDWQTGEAPGKIIHEQREDELSRTGELPYRRYYGSVDSTPLFLILAAEYVHWTGDLATLASLRQAIHAALNWLRDYGDPDHDGLFEYATDSGSGLRNQGWKDSVEAIAHADGQLCNGPIALAEVQGYVYLAYQRLAPIFDHLGEPRTAETLRLQADLLRHQFQQAFWIPEDNLIAMALDGNKQPVRVMSSNAGQTLWSGIVEPEQAALVRDALFQNDMFSGWGVRTLSARASTYFPLGYHLGTVWPHDNGIIALGLKHYGMETEANEIATALFDAAQQFPFQRLPELIGGHARVDLHPPVPYPVACRPQAWTAGTVLHLLQAILGIKGNALAGRLEVERPRLPYWLNSVSVDGVQCGGARVSLQFEAQRGRTSVIPSVDGDLSVVVNH